MKVEVIYTFNKTPSQNIKEHLITEQSIKTKEGFLDYILAFIEDSDKMLLSKISTCIKLDGEPKSVVPEWYWECRGKFMFEKGKIRAPAWKN